MDASFDLLFAPGAFDVLNSAAPEHMRKCSSSGSGTGAAAAYRGSPSCGGCCDDDGYDDDDLWLPELERVSMEALAADPLAAALADDFSSLAAPTAYAAHHSPRSSISSQSDLVPAVLQAAGGGLATSYSYHSFESASCSPAWPHHHQTLQQPQHLHLESAHSTNLLHGRVALAGCRGGGIPGTPAAAAAMAPAGWTAMSAGPHRNEHALAQAYPLAVTTADESSEAGAAHHAARRRCAAERARRTTSLAPGAADQQGGVRKHSAAVAPAGARSKQASGASKSAPRRAQQADAKAHGKSEVEQLVRELAAQRAGHKARLAKLQADREHVAAMLAGLRESWAAMHARSTHAQRAAASAGPHVRM